MKQSFLFHLLLFYNTWTKLKHIHTHTHTHTRAHTHTRTHTHTHAYGICTHTYAHTHRSGALRFEESLSLAHFCYLVTLTEVDQKQRIRYLCCIHINSQVSRHNRDLFGILAFSWVWKLLWCFRVVDGNLQLMTSLRDVTGEPLSWLAVSLWRDDGLRKFV